jgi:hypothetical protein
MANFRSHPSGRSSRKGPTKRFFKGLVMPSVAHPKGAVPEAFQPHTDPKGIRFAVGCCVAAILLFSVWLAFIQLRKLVLKSPAPTHPSEAPLHPPRRRLLVPDPLFKSSR